MSNIALFAGLAVLISRNSVHALKCGCGASGDNPGTAFLQFVASPTPDKTGSNYCLTGPTCTAEPGYGCYRLITTQGNATFCGSKGESNLEKGNQVQYLINMNNVMGQDTAATVVDLGICTGSNLNSYGLCYCETGDLCNVMNVSARQIAKNSASVVALSVLAAIIGALSFIIISL